MRTIVRKRGNVLTIRIPAHVAAQVNLRVGTEVAFTTSGGVLAISAKRPRKYALAELLAKAKGRFPHYEFVRDGRIGRELI